MKKYRLKNNIIELQLILMTLREFKDNKNDNIQRAVLDLIEKIYDDIK